MAKYIWDEVTKHWVPKEEYYAGQSRNVSACILPDLPDFVSPIDRSVIHGRAGMREHCRIHNVVPTADLQGLPPKPSVNEYKPDRAAIREALKRQFYK